MVSIVIKNILSYIVFCQYNYKIWSHEILLQKVKYNFLYVYCNYSGKYLQYLNIANNNLLKVKYFLIHDFNII